MDDQGGRLSAMSALHKRLRTAFRTEDETANTGPSGGTGPPGDVPGLLLRVVVGERLESGRGKVGTLARELIADYHERKACIERVGSPGSRTEGKKTGGIEERTFLKARRCYQAVWG